MKIARGEQREQWDLFIGGHKMAPFLQSWGWGDFQQVLGREVERWVAIDESGEWLAATQVIISEVNFKLAKKRYWWVARGPVAMKGDGGARAVEGLMKFLAERARAAGAMFLRWEPLDGEDVAGDEWQTVKNTQPAKTWMLDLRPEAEELLAMTHPKTRYNIRLAERKGVEIEVGSGEKMVKDFYKVLKHTAEREKFGVYGEKYYRQLAESLGCVAADGGWVDSETASFKIYVARFKNEVVGGIGVALFGDMATYLYGGFDEKYRALMAPHGLQWRAITDARVAGCHYYDFWGVAPQGADEHAWAGLSRFKRSFGGFEVDYPRAREVVLNKTWAGAYRWGKRFLK